MTKPLFSLVVCGRNESKTLPKLLGTLAEFFSRGGDMVYVDTGSTDSSVEVARAGGAKVFEVGDRFRYVCDEETAKAINTKFVKEYSEGPIIKAGDAFFAFDQARNYAMDLAENDFICTPDCDEAWTTLNIDALNALIEQGYEKLIVDFVFSHFPDGKPQVEFAADTRFYDRRKIKWKGIIHETMQEVDGPVKTVRISKEIAYLEHFQNKETDRTRYLSGLAWACHREPENDRNSHYFARELMYYRKWHSAIAEFHRHIDMNGWPDERAQSMVYLGDCYNAIGEEKTALMWWHEAMTLGTARRSPFINLAHYWKRKDNRKMVAAYAAAAMEIPDNGFYANRKADYTFEPHALMYWAKGWLGDIPAAREHLLKCLEYHPTEMTFHNDMKYYFTDDEVREKYAEAFGKAERKIDRIALPITRACNRNCPECSARCADPDWDRTLPHTSVDELKWVGKNLGPIKTIEVTGGEPSIHPDFKEISENIHEWFECKDIMVLTNAVEFYNYPEKLPLLLNYDRVYISWYTNDFAVKYNVDANTAAVNFVEDYLKRNGKSAWVQRMDRHDPIGKPPYKGVCKYGYDRGDSVGYGAGKIWGCCTAFWLSDKGTGIPLTPEWREHIGDIVLPCKSCFISGMRCV